MEVNVHEGKIWTADNRRIAVLKMYQALNLDKTVTAPCRVLKTTSRFLLHLDTPTDGLSIAPRISAAPAKHLGADVFDPADQAQQVHRRLAQKYGAGNMGV